MVRHLSLLTLTEEGRKHYGEATELFTKVVQVTEAAGGKILWTYALDGRFDFVSVVEYPSPEAAFEARLKVLETGIVTIESAEAFDMEFYLEKV